MVDVKSLLPWFQSLCRISEFLGRYFLCQQPLVSEKDRGKLQGCSQDDEALVWWGTCVLANVQASVWLQRAEPGRPGTAMMWLRDVCIGVWVQTLRWDTGTECLCSWLCSSLIEVSLMQQENWNSVFQHWAAYNKLFYFCTCLINTELFSVVTQCGFVPCCWESV